MAFTLDADTKERVRAATDIVDLISSFIELRRQGRAYVALCPFHKDRRPSLQVNPERQIWKCWVCDIGGDVFNFVMQYEGIGFPDAMRMLAERAGIQLENFNPAARKTSAGSSDDKQILYRVMAWASRLYHQHLLKSPEAETARQYLTERGITAESIANFEIGLAPSSWSYLAEQVQAAGYSVRQLEATGLCGRSERGSIYDRFRQRIMFPIRDSQKRIIAFGGRVLPGSTEGAKYINSPESKIFTKNQHLYGLDRARDTIRERRQAIVMEGYTDVIVAHQAGLTSSVAVLGTALGANHLKLLRHIADQVILLLDGDEAGQRRSDEVLELFLSAQMDVRVLTLPNGMDPADYLQQHTADTLLELASHAPDALEFKMRRVCEGFDPIEETHRANSAVEQMLNLLAKVPRSTLMADDQFRMRRNQVLARLARRFMIQEDELRARLRNLAEKAARSPRSENIADRRFNERRSAEQPTERNTDRYQEPQRLDRQPLDASDPTGTIHSDPGLSSTPPAPHLADAVDQPTSKRSRLIRPGDLSPVERELLELLVSAPTLAPMVLERVTPDWLQSDAARAMLDAYHELELEGYSLQFDSVLVAIEDPSLKSLMVTLYEQAQVKQQFVRDTPEQRLRVLTQRMGQMQEEQQRRRQLLQFEDGGLDDDTELSLLSEFIRQARQSHGLDDRQLLDQSPEHKPTGQGLYDDVSQAENPAGPGDQAMGPNDDQSAPPSSGRPF